MSLQDSRQLENVKVLLKVGADGRGIAEIVKVGTSGVVDTYDIVLTDGTRFPFDVTNGSSIATIEKTATVGLVDTYTITLTNGDTFEFEVTNADGSTAGTVDYDNTGSGLDATNVQDAIDEVNAKADTKTDQSLIATVQPNLTAVKAYAVGAQFVYQGLLYKATATISSGGTITIGGNCELADSVTEQIDSINNWVDITSELTWNENLTYKKAILNPLTKEVKIKFVNSGNAIANIQTYITLPSKYQIDFSRLLESGTVVYLTYGLVYYRWVQTVTTSSPFVLGVPSIYGNNPQKIILSYPVSANAYNHIGDISFYIK